MTRTRITLFACLFGTTLLAGCPAGTTGNDAATTDGGARVDANEGGGTTTDAGCTTGACDGGVPDAGVDAASVDAAMENDAGVDCATIGCGAPPICGEACDAPCGCCPCAEGDTMGSYVCTGGCWAPRGTGGDGDPCTATSDCGGGLSCCYPCGIPGCSSQCTPTCASGTPGCEGGCPLVP